MEDTYLEMTDDFFKKVVNENPSIKTKQQAAVYLGNEMDAARLEMPENQEYEIDVMKYDTTHGDLALHVGTIESVDCLEAMKPALRQWFLDKYADNKGVYLSVSKIGKQPMWVWMSGLEIDDDLEEKDFGEVFKVEHGDSHDQ